MTTPSEVADELMAEAAALDGEIEEIDMLVAQARTEAGRHETRRSAADEKVARLDATGAAKEAVDLAKQVVILTRRAALMDAQIEILDAKKRSLARLQETLRAGAEKARAIGTTGPSRARGGPPGGAGAGPAVDDEDDSTQPAVSRLVLAAQEDLRREIARAMHDGPAQSLTNIVLQAEIVERLVGRDPKSAASELRALVAMVQSTLEATKTFIFDVRPMVLDDLGLVPTLRRSARDRGQRAEVPVTFESIGADRRLPTETESAMFRMADDALAAYLHAKPDRAAMTLDWGESLVLTVRAERTARTVAPLDIPEEGEALPPALAEMVADRRVQHATAIEQARASALVKLPARLQRDLKQRSTTLGIGLEFLEDGGCLRVSVATSAAGEVVPPVTPEPAA